MPLRGKILNTWEVDSDQVLGSQEIHDISVAVGVEPGSTDISNLRYGKVCILADADSDGAHIATLICALFVKHFRPMVEAGHIYIAMPPLYRVDIGKKVEYALDESTRRLIQLTLEDPADADATMDMLLAKKRASDRKSWLETKGDLAII